ncbi:hypothetical protein JTE90_025979 [Oedothorax gibbosus]|uniref:Uncharacterized protein n=1 Tax=Oedothorax gibbosus TaxID=931172 RepID=A0AAV6U686_9ARAC|nr:hypothetical protein JTE90_025979 [Oedothorax gibbosus]
MDTTNEQTDKPGSNKPPLLPKPCLASISSGPSEHVIPQMVITSPDDNECSELASETATVPDILVSESPPCDVPDNENDPDLHTKASESYVCEDSQPPIQSFEVAESKNETRIDDPVPHSAVQRPLVFESEKCAPEPNVEDQSIPSVSQTSSPLPSISPVTSSQRPMVFGGSNVQSVNEDEVFEEFLDDDLANTESQDADGIVLDELNINEDCKTPEPDAKPKSSSFSWMPTFPKLHASGKDAKSSEAGSSKKDTEVLDNPKLASLDQDPVKKDGLHNMKKFFGNLRHDTSNESKDISSPDNQNLESSGESAKKVPKEGKHGIKKLFSPTKQDSKLSDKDVSSENIKDTENVSKEHHKESKSNIKRMFDSFKPTDKKEDPSKTEQHHPHTEDTSTTHEPKREGESKEHSKESKSNLKKMFDSFKHVDKKDSPTKIEQDHPRGDDTSSSNEPKKDLFPKENELKEHSKESKSNLKKMFDSFKHADKKDNITKTEAENAQGPPSTPKEPKKVEDTKSNLKKMLDSIKPVEKKGPKNEFEPSQIDTASDASKTEKGSKSPIKKFFDSFKHEDMPVEVEVPKQTAKTDDLFLDNKDSSAPKLKSSLKQSSDSQNFDNKESNSQGLNPIITSQDASTSQTYQPKQLEEATPRQSTNEHGVKKFFRSFRSSTPSTSKEQTGKFHVTFLDGDGSLKRSHSFQESILIKDSKSHEANEKTLKDKIPSVTTSNECVSDKVAKKSKSKPVKRSQSCKETLAEKQGFHGIRGFFDSITHKTPKVQSQTTLSSSSKTEEALLSSSSKEALPSSIKKEALPSSNEKEALPSSNEKEALPPSNEKEALPSSSKMETLLSSSEKEGVLSSSKKVPASSSKKEEHIYDVVGKPETSDSSQAITSSQTVQDSNLKPLAAKSPQTSKGEHSGVRKLFDSFLHKESPSTKEKATKREINGERIYEKIDISSSVESSSHAGRTFMDMKRERLASVDKSEPVNQTNKSKKAKEVTKITQSPLEFVQERKTDTKIPSAQVNGQSAPTDSKPSVFHSISDNFNAIKDRVLHSKEKKSDIIVKQDKVIQEYDLESAASKNGLPDISAGTFRPLKDDLILVSDHKKETETQESKISDKSIDLSLPSTSKQSSSSAAISKPLKSPDLKAGTKVEPGTPDTLYDTCCVRLAHLLGKKALEIVSDKTKTPPKKPPKPSAEAIAKARAEVVSQRLRNLPNKGLSIGESIPVGYDGIRFADDETESSCDYKDVANLDYIIDYDLVNRYKFDGKGDTFSAQSVCSISSYYTADTVTLKDENFSDAPLETISLGSNESIVFQNLSANSQTDFNSLPAKIKAKNKNISKLKELKSQTKDSSNIPTLKKKIPPPLPPKPLLTPKSKDNEKTKKEPVSQCINGLSLSPRLQSKFLNDTAATQKRPLFVAGLRGTEFTSLQTKSKDTPTKRPFNTVLKNESLKKISPISPLHTPLQSTKSSPPQLSETQNTQQSSKPKKVGPERPPPPFSPSHSEDITSKTSTGPPVPEKPKREHKVLSPQASSSGKRTISPIRPPPKPPIAAKIQNIPPPRPPPPTKQAEKHPPYQNLEGSSGVISRPQSLDELPEGSYSIESESDRYDDALECAHVERCSSVKFIEINLHESSVEKEVKKVVEKEQSIQKLEMEHAPMVREDFTPEPDSQLTMSMSIDHSPLSSAACSPVPTSTPKPPPRGRRIRSRTVEIASRESVKETLPRRSQSLTEIDVQKRTESLNLPTSSEKVDLKILYTSVNKKRTSNGSQSPSLGARPLPAPPPPPRKFRSLDRKPKEKSKEQTRSNEDENKNSLPDQGTDDITIKPPERKKKVEKRFHSLSAERKKNNFELSQEDSRIPRSNSVPLKPDRRLRHSHGPEYDENANVAFPVVAEVHHSAIELDECGNEILESPKTNIPSEDTVDSAAGNTTPKAISPHPRRKKDKSAKVKSHSSWYDEHQPSSESWEVVDWEPSIVSEESIKGIYSLRKKPLRRRSDPLAGRKERRTSQFYVNVDLDEGLPHVDKETSPLHLDCSEKSVQTSLETLSQGLISRDEQSPESSDNTDHLLSMVKTLQTELKTTLDRHKGFDSDGPGSSSNAPTDSEKSDKPRRLSKSNSIHSTTPELWPATSSEESDGEVGPDAEANLSEIARTRKKKKVFYIAQEIMTSEEGFVDTLKLLNVDFKSYIEAANKQKNTPVVPDEVLNQILNHLPQLQHLNENLLMELKDRIDNWNKTEKIADVIVKMGPFLKLYSWFIHDFESNLSLLEESKKKYHLFAQCVKEFEASARCKRLTLNHFMLKPIQRIPQYRLLLQEYLHNLSEDSPDYQDTVTALQIVSEVANHANDSMKQGDNAHKLISIQNSIMGHKEIIKPGRLFIKEGELMKLSRKGMQPRWFVLFNDLLLYLTPVQQGLYRINHELPLTGMRVAIPVQQDYQNEFSIISVTRSFTLAARSQEEREEWINVLEDAIKENASKRSTFTNTRLSQRVPGKSAEDDSSEFVLGRKAPVWIPDARVTMCQLCTSEFTVTFRRHHCRACGKVVCSICSSNKIPLTYIGSNKVNRVCDECYSKLGPDSRACPESGETDSDNQQIAVKPHLRTERHVKKYKRNLPSVLKEVCANDQGSTISGYLQKRVSKSWKREWFVVKDKVLYEYKASEDVAALRSIPLLGYQIESFSEAFENVDSSLLFQLTHPGQAPIIFYADTVGSTERWIAALKEASVLE